MLGFLRAPYITLTSINNQQPIYAHATIFDDNVAAGQWRRGGFFLGGSAVFHVDDQLPLRLSVGTGNKIDVVVE